MKKNRFYHIGLFTGLLFFVFSACDDNIDPVVEELNLNRALTPLELVARIRNMTTAELSWAVRSDVDSYVVEISEGNLDFSSIIKTENVAPDQVPFSIVLDGETQYSARVKAVKDGTSDSKWAIVVFQTDIENLFQPVAAEDISATSVIVRWTPGSDVTHFLITPGDTERPITAEEKELGEATIEGLTSDLAHTVKLFNDGKQRGAVSFNTLVDIGDAVAVYPEDDLNAVISAAAAGDVLVLFPGDYLVYTGSITINKSISIRGLYPYDKPKVHVEFALADGVQSVQVQDLDMNGDGSIVNAFSFANSATGYGSLDVIGCNIHDYTRALIGGTGMATTLQSVSVTNSIVSDIVSSGGDFIDFRVGYVASLTLKNSTFNNCAPARDFIRLDNSSANFPGLVTNVLVENCTLYGVSHGTSRRVLYVRFVDNVLNVKNTLIAGTDGIYTNQSLSSQPVCSKNNYFNAPGFFTPDYVANVKIDQSGNHTTLDPGFANAATGDFTVSNQSVIDNNIGDPRWLP